MKCGWSEMITYLHVTIKIKYMITINDLMELDGMYYVGDLVDMDGSGWVSRKVAEDLIYNLNIDYVS